MLEGLDDEWVYAGNAREATYANVPSGDYRFRVSTTRQWRVDRGGVWDFSVAPPFYRTREFVVAVWRSG